MPDEMSADEFNALAAQRKASKYHNEKTEVDGIMFDSIAEARHYWDLRHMERAGEITDLELQPVFPLIVNGVKVAQYRADFAYVDVATGRRIVQDVKGVRTPVFALKAKMVKAQYGIDVEEIAA